MRNKKSSCSYTDVAMILLAIGGINWGLVGLSMIFGGGNWNIVNLILGGVPVIEAIVYIVVGLSALVVLLGCKCKGKKCEPCDRGVCDEHAKKKEM